MSLVAVVGIGGVGVRTLTRQCERLLDGPTLIACPDGVLSGQAAGDLPAGPEPGPSGFEPCGSEPCGPEPDVALMVLDPSSSIGADEVAVLDRLRGRARAVALVCTKVDAFWRWPQILRAHREVCDPGHTLPVFAVSAAAAEAGALDESGLTSLVDWIEEVLSESDEVGRDSARPTAADRAVAVAIGDMEADSVSGLAGRRRRLLRRRQAALASRESGRADRAVALRAEIAALRAEHGRRVEAAVRALDDAAQRSCDAVQLAGIGRSAGAEQVHAGWLTGQIGRVRTELAEHLEERLDEIEAVVCVGSRDSGTDTEPRCRTHEPSAAAAPESPAGSRGPRRTAEDALVMVLGLSTGLGAGRVVAMMTAGGIGSWSTTVCSVLVGLAVAVWVIGARRSTVSRAELRSWTGRSLAALRADLERGASMQLAAAEVEISARLARDRRRHLHAVDTEIAAVDADLQRLRRDEVAAERHQQVCAVHGSPHAPTPDPAAPPLATIT